MVVNRGGLGLLANKCLPKVTYIMNSEIRQFLARQLTVSVKFKSGLMTFWIWLSFVLLLSLAVTVLYQWYQMIKMLSYPHHGRLVGFSHYKEHAQLARFGIIILLPLALVAYLKRSTSLSWLMRWLYFFSIALSFAVVAIFLTTKFFNF